MTMEHPTVARAPEALLEREREIECIDVAIAAAQAGRGRAVLVEGPPGIGKTDLLATARDRARAAGLTVLTARGGELERDYAFGMVRQLFEPAVRAAPPDGREALLTGAARPAAELLGFDSGEGRRTLVLPAFPATSEDPSFPLLHGLYWLCANLAEGAPVGLVVDDAHWADAPSLRWLAYLLRRLEDLPVLAVVGTRPPEHGGDELLRSIATDPGVELLQPQPLSEAAVGELLGDAADEAFRAACHAATGGNPFLLRELSEELAAKGVEPTAAAAGQIRSIGPRRVARAVLVRLQGLPPGATTLARAVALLGTFAEPRHAATLAALERDEAAAAQDALVRADILEPGAPLGFVHPIVRAAVYEDVGPAERTLGHLAAAKLLGSDAAPPERVAGHLLAAQATGDPWVVGVLRDAASLAFERGASDAAVAYLRRALEEPPSPESRPSVLLELGRAETRAREPAAVEHLEQALELSEEPVAHARAALDLGRALYMAGRLPDAMAVYGRAIERLAGADRDLELALEQELIAAARLNPATRAVADERLERLAPKLDSRSPAVRPLLAGQAFDEAMRGQSARKTIDLAMRALERGTLLRLGSAESPAFHMAVFALAMSDALVEAADALAAGFADSRARGSVLGFVICSTWSAQVNYRRGQLADAEADARNALEVVEQSGWEVGRPATEAFLVDILLERGEVEAAEAALARSAPEDGDASVVGNTLLRTRGRLRMEQGRWAEALEDFEAVGKRQEAWGSPNPALIAWRSSAALALSALERHDEARRLAAEELSLARRFGAPRAIGVALRAAGLVADAKQAEALLLEAVEMLEDSPATLVRARALADYGGVLRRSGRRSAAREPLRAALDLAHRCGSGLLAEKVRPELLATGARPRRVMLTGLESLTPSERRVVTLAAEGRSNRDIAQTLFLSVKTIEVHLTRAYGKLGVKSRDELAEALARPAA